MRTKCLPLLIALVLAACKSDNDAEPAVTPQATVTVNVDLILPLAQQEDWKASVDEALGNIEQAQQACNKRVKLNLRYHDENTEDLEKLAFALTRPGKGDAPYVEPDTCHAIIGPMYSVHARTILDQAQRSRLPVIMPTCSSVELQRTEAQQPYSFFLTESDITQCELLLTIIKEVGHQQVALLYTDDIYGQSFREWFGFLATQMQLKVVTGGIQAYREGESLDGFFTRLQSSETDKGQPAVILALGDSKLYPKVLTAGKQFYENQPAPSFFVSDMGMTPATLAFPVMGTYASGSAENGYLQDYQSRHGDNPPYGAAQIYDALSMIALGRAAQLAAPNPNELYIDGEKVEYELAPQEPVLSDWIRAVVATGGTAPLTQWTTVGLANAFRLIEGGTMPNLNGATGALNFAAPNRTTILNTTYVIWKAVSGEAMPVATMSTDGSGSISTQAMWEWQALVEEIDDVPGLDHDLPALGQRWAVVISPSTTWLNYRHQADAFSMYQTLRHHGYDDDHIVLIVEDNLADSPNNPYPGEIFVERSAKAGPPDHPDPLVNENVRSQAVVDYHFSDLQGPDDLSDIIRGVKSERLPHVINPTESDNVFLFWSGHGSDDGGPLWGNEDCHDPFGTQRIRSIVEAMQSPRRYRRMLLAVETCYSGQWGEALTGLPDVLILTAANAVETSKPDEFNTEMKTYLSNAFSRTFRRSVTNNPGISLRDLYYSLYRTTCGSHVKFYNIEKYGSVYQNTMSDYLAK